MTTLLWLAASSLVWGAVLVGAVIALQSRSELSGRARQWMWRGAAMLLVLPWLAVPLIHVLAPGLALSLAPVVEATAVPAAGPADVVVTSMPLDAVGFEPVVADRPGIVLPWVEIFVAVIAAGWLLRFGVAQVAAFRMRRLLQSATPAPEGPSRDALNIWSHRLLLRRKPDLRVMDGGMSPFSSGALRPVIGLPRGIEQRVRPEALGLIVGHECIHVARGDGWWRPAERAIADVLWFNPFAWTIRRELDLARELACDEAVVAASSSRRAYARTLRDVAGMVSGLSPDAPAAAMSIGGGGRFLAMRMKRTLATAGRAPGRAAIVGAIILAFAAAPVAIAQALLIEAVQPPDPPPAPETPPLPETPEPPEAPEAFAAPEAPEPSEAIESLEIPVAPPGPPAAADAQASRSISVAPRVAATTPPRATTTQTRAPLPPKTPPAPVLMLAPHAPHTPPTATLTLVPHEPPAPVLMLVPHTPPAPAVAPVAPAPHPAPAPMLAPAPPAPPAIIKAKAGEMLHIWFPAQVVALQPDKDQPGAYSMKLVQTEAIPTMEGCTARLTGMTDIRVVADQKIPAGAPVGVVGEDSHTTISCQTIKTISKLKKADKTDIDAAQLARAIERSRAVVVNAPRLRIGPLASIEVRAVELEPLSQLAGSSPKLEGAPHPVLATKARKTSGFGIVTDPKTGKTGLHEGVDLAARLGTPVHSPGPATVVFAGDKGKYGNTVELKLGSGHVLRFSHLEEIKVAAGETVQAGTVIGTVGDDEFTTGPHLHLEYRAGGRAVDPEKVEGLNLTAPD